MQTGAIVNGSYEILGQLGRGDYGITYAALDQATGRKCAIKCLSLASQVDIPTVERFRNEAKLLKNLTHPGIPRFLDFFTIEEQTDTKLYLVRELVEGRNLRELVNDGLRFTERRAILTAVSVLDILIYLHDFSPPVIHKDIKPENIILGGNETAYLADFNFIGDETLAGAGSLIGRYGYVPPGQLRKESGPATDIYSLAMTVFFVLSRKDPALVNRTGEGGFEYGPLVNISPKFLAVLEKMSAPAVKDRYQTAREARDALLALLASPKKDRRLLIVFASVLLAMGTVYALLPGKRIVPVRPAQSTRIPAMTNRGQKSEKSFFQSSAPPVIHMGFDGHLEGKGVRFTGSRGQTDRLAFISGAVGEAVEFPGNLEYVQDQERNFQNSYTIAFRLKFGDDFPASGEHLTILKSGMITYDARGTGRTIVFVHFAGGGHFNLDVSDVASPFRPGQWHHIAFVKDHAQEVFLAYRDGVAIARRPIRYNDQVLAGVMDVIKIGGARRSPDRAIAFGLDEFEVYDYARSPEQIAREAGTKLPAPGRSASGQTAMTGDGGGVTVNGRLLHAGNPLAEYTNEAPSFWFRNEVTGLEAREVRAVWEEGAYRFTGLQPGRYGVQVWVNAEKENPNGYPGDYETWHTFIVQDGDAGPADIDLMKVLRLTSPQDNWSCMTRWSASCEGKHSFTSPVVFSWESLGPDVEYRYTIDNRTEATANTSVIIDFPPAERDRCHSFKLTARHGGRTIGRMLTHGINGGLGWDYVFRVE